MGNNQGDLQKKKPPKQPVIPPSNLGTAAHTSRPGGATFPAGDGSRISTLHVTSQRVEYKNPPNINSTNSAATSTSTSTSTSNACLYSNFSTLNIETNTKAMKPAPKDYREKRDNLDMNRASASASTSTSTSTSTSYPCLYPNLSNLNIETNTKTMKPAPKDYREKRDNLDMNRASASASTSNTRISTLNIQTFNENLKTNTEAIKPAYADLEQKINNLVMNQANHGNLGHLNIAQASQTKIIHNINRGRGNNHNNYNINDNNRGGRNRGRGGNNLNPNRGNPGNRGNRGNPGNRGNRGGRGNCGPNRNRGNHNNVDRNLGPGLLGIPPGVSQPQGMDWFCMAPAQELSNQSFTANDLPIRNNYGGRYGNSEDTKSESNKSVNNRGRGRNRREHRPQFMGFKKLEEILQLEPDEIVLGLCSGEAGFENLLKSELSADYIVLVIRVISKCCQTTFPENKGKILTRVCEKDFTSQLIKYLNEISLADAYDRNRNKYFWMGDNANLFWKNLLEFYESIIDLIPNTAIEILPKMLKQTILTVTNLETIERISIEESVKAGLEDIQLKLALCSEEREKKKLRKPDLMQDEEPPDDFRAISLYPMVHEITQRDDKAFLRSNIISGSYRDVEHYLDVHFRLLREDFVAPLRDGICQHLNQKMSGERKRIFNVRFYEKVTFISKYTVKDKVAVVIQLNVGKRKIKWENSRRFMFGSLLCFTNNNFQSVVFGTVVESRDRKLTDRNQIAVDLLNENIAYGPAYTMVECNVFFNPYYHVLKALQAMREDRFPLKRYIIDVEPEVFPPRYLNEFSSYDHRRHRFFPLRKALWPSAEDLGLDLSQYRAFQAALTKEFCVIQGPPGTGKTYIGLRIAEVLLENCEHWNSQHNPILVICYTNHALDQFLEGICEYTKKLVRIGGQSKNENLKLYNINEMRRKYHRSKDGNRVMYQRRDEIRLIMNEIQRLQKILDGVVYYNRIIDITGFEIIDERIRNSWFMSAKKSELLEWLMGGRTAEERYQERRKQRIAQQVAQNVPAAENDEENDSDSENEFFDPEEEIQRELDDVDEVFATYVLSSINSQTLLTKQELEEQINDISRKLADIDVKAEETNNFVVFDERGMAEVALNKLHEDYDYFNWRMDQLKTGTIPPRPLVIDYNNPHLLKPNERWGLYAYWLNLYRHSLLAKLNKLDENYRKVYKEYEEVKHMEDIKLMKDMHVIGMTTCGAARYQTILQALKCPIVIVEEAAEVLESHVVVSLTNDCQHLILIGDHKQLRPTTAEYRLQKDYQLDISLFERMVTNKIHCETLEIQHRMRPEIVNLIVPAIYPKLESAAKVYTYPPVHGVTKNLFFITHTEPEEDVDDSGSRKNVHEAKFLIKLARHFVLQGYEPEDITILATYSGQMFCLWKERKNVPCLKDVRITGVDNYQGEENKLILLSLVRSNSKADIGFLKIDNRVNVALSRAKEGLFIIGNMSILEQSNNAWPKIKQTLESNNQIGPHLTLQCQVHRDELTHVRTADDFKKVTEGGCSQLCGSQLNCGHICRSLCHIINRDHLKYECKEQCTKGLCEIGHPCPLKCYQECQPCKVLLPVVLACGHQHNLPCHINDTSNHPCPTLVDTKLECGHVVPKPCHKNAKKFPCPHPCDVRKPCGHACERRCHIYDDPDHLQSKCFKKCERGCKGCTQKDNPHKCLRPCYEECMDCEVKVQKVREPCGHIWTVPCQESVNDIKCTKRCKNKLNCGHNCKLECWEPCGRCDVEVQKVVETCGHKVKGKCSEPVDRSKCRGICPRPLQCGHPCNKKCNEPCSTSCTALVDSPFAAACGHQFKIPCNMTRKGVNTDSMELLKYCEAPCNEILQCGHPCAGTCGTCAQGRIHATCQEKCGATLICGHECDIPCREICQPCNKKCYYRCVHNKCGKKCGEPCTECKEKCKRMCMHGACTRLCSEPCNVPPCKEPCPKLLRCKHPCIGLCGDPCPPVCRVCNANDETFVFFFGDEDEPDARFVYLEECKHSIEAGAMDRWVQLEPAQAGESQDSEINLKGCPRCKTIIMTLRYSEYFKQVFRDITEIKRRFYLEDEESTRQREELQTELANLRQDNLDLYRESKHFKTLLKEIVFDLNETNNGKRNPLNKLILHSCNVKIELTKRMIVILRKGDLKSNPEFYSKCLKYFDLNLEHLIENESRISSQKISDLELEIRRLEKYHHLFTIEKNTNFAYAFTKPTTKSLYLYIYNKLESIGKYSVDTDAELKKYLEDLRQLVDKTISITDEERKAIVKAIGLEKGRWFKCPNGHFFAIGECGGAMQISKCADCGVAVGGQNHALLDTNQFAPEMDGAAFPAWSDAANLANYVLD